MVILLEKNIRREQNLDIIRFRDQHTQPKYKASVKGTIV